MAAGGAPRPERRVLSIKRHLHADETDAFLDDVFARLRSAGPGLEGIQGAPYLIFYGEVSADCDGPMELCRPVSAAAAITAAKLGADVEARVEPDLIADQRTARPESLVCDLTILIA
jgi:hypothetical protein